MCETCVYFDNASDDDKTSLKKYYERHLKEKELLRCEKKDDKENANAIVSVDITYKRIFKNQKGVSVFYYKLKLNVFNLTIYDVKSIGCIC